MVKQFITWLYVKYVLEPEVMERARSRKVYVMQTEVYQAMYEKDVLSGICRTDHEEIGMSDVTREELADRIVSNPRLIDLLGEKDRRINELEVELYDARVTVQKIVEFLRFINSIPKDASSPIR